MITAKPRKPALITKTPRTTPGTAASSPRIVPLTIEDPAGLLRQRPRKWLMRGFRDSDFSQEKSIFGAQKMGVTKSLENDEQPTAFFGNPKNSWRIDDRILKKAVF